MCCKLCWLWHAPWDWPIAAFPTCHHDPWCAMQAATWSAGLACERTWAGALTTLPPAQVRPHAGCLEALPVACHYATSKYKNCGPRSTGLWTHSLVSITTKRPLPQHQVLDGTGKVTWLATQRQLCQQLLAPIRSVLGALDRFSVGRVRPSCELTSRTWLSVLRIWESVQTLLVWAGMCALLSRDRPPAADHSSIIVALTAGSQAGKLATVCMCLATFAVMLSEWGWGMHGSAMLSGCVVGEYYRWKGERGHKEEHKTDISEDMCAYDSKHGRDVSHPQVALQRSSHARHSFWIEITAAAAWTRSVGEPGSYNFQCDLYCKNYKKSSHNIKPELLLQGRMEEKAAWARLERILVLGGRLMEEVHRCRKTQLENLAQHVSSSVSVSLCVCVFQRPSLKSHRVVKRTPICMVCSNLQDVLVRDGCRLSIISHVFLLSFSFFDCPQYLSLSLSSSVCVTIVYLLTVRQ